ncbi:phosphatidylserine decarboxylase [Sediminitomix flava]|uniref:Phosphatidylserine decarboxylase proenzyme n=1 Tax=Sediminitomix flava TaxID=379075 RepID=A0A315ZGL5_SEDFL|nr:phosphatidylserine decarboxylase [Sediminitomix flava]PWJ44299.1 phosphatidylserine decarboxylase [Sediminitomix flava]
MESSVTYIEREEGIEITELIPGAKTIAFLYQKPLGKLTLSFLLKRKFVSALVGRVMNTSFSKKYIKGFVEKHGIDLAEFEPKEYTSFNDFFYRKLKPNTRKISDGIVSPADGKILVFPNMENVKEFFVKGSSFGVDTFLNNQELVQKYQNGSMAIIRLAPADYHRFHFPASGQVSETHLIKGDYFSVSPLALDKSLEIFCQNKRTYSILKTAEAGDILISEVGATLVGSIIQTYAANSEVEKGDEKGYFTFGGSTLVLFFEKGKIMFDQDLVANTSNGYETTVKMGEKIACLS